MRISDWSSDVCSSDLTELTPAPEDARYRAAFPESGGSLHFRKFLETEVIPFIEARYRTGERRAVMGESLAGLFVIDTLLRQADLFHDSVAVRPSLWWDDSSPVRIAPQSRQRSQERRGGKSSVQTGR